MPRVYPVIVKRTTVTGGTGNVGWGPNFGGLDGDQFGCGVGLLPFEPPAVEIPKTCGCNLDLEKIDLSHGKTCGCTVSSFTADPTNTKTCGCNLDLEKIDLSHGKTCGCNIDLIAVDPSYSKTAGTHLSGTAAGAPFWQRVATTTGASGISSITADMPSGVVSGDLLIASICTLQTGTAGEQVDTPTGWTPIYKASATYTVGNLLWHSTFYRVADGAEGSSQVFTFARASQTTLAEIHLIRGVSASTPVNATNVVTVSHTATDPDPAAPSVTTTATSCLVLSLLFHYHAALSNTHTPASGHVEYTDFESGVLVVSSSSMGKVFPASGATGGAVHNCTELVATASSAVRVAIAPGTTTIAS